MHAHLHPSFPIWILSLMVGTQPLVWRRDRAGGWFWALLASPKFSFVPLVPTSIPIAVGSSFDATSWGQLCRQFPAYGWPMPAGRFCLPRARLQTLSHLIIPVQSFQQETSESRISSPPFPYHLQPWASYLTTEPQFSCLYNEDNCTKWSHCVLVSWSMRDP